MKFFKKENMFSLFKVQVQTQLIEQSFIKHCSVLASLIIWEEKSRQKQVRKKNKNIVFTNPPQNTQTSEKDTWDKGEITQIPYVTWSSHLCKMCWKVTNEGSASFPKGVKEGFRERSFGAGVLKSDQTFAGTEYPPKSIFWEFLCWVGNKAP